MENLNFLINYLKAFYLFSHLYLLHLFNAELLLNNFPELNTIELNTIKYFNFSLKYKEIIFF